jgi:hypothetical protein
MDFVDAVFRFARRPQQPMRPPVATANVDFRREVVQEAPAQGQFEKSEQVR